VAPIDRFADQQPLAFLQAGFHAVLADDEIPHEDLQQEENGYGYG
jgi:hypothetical protein